MTRVVTERQISTRSHLSIVENLTKDGSRDSIVRTYIDYMYSSGADKYEKRGALRHELDVPVILPSGRGRTRDMSGTGIYFETESEIELGPIRFSIGLDVVSEDVEIMECEGQVLRIDERPAGRGVAARIDRIDL